MLKKRGPPLTDFALPIPGTLGVPSRARTSHEDRIRYAKARVEPEAAGAPGQQIQAEPSVGTANGQPLSKAELAALDDAALLRRFQHGDEAAFYTLFERRHKEIYTHCYRLCGRDAEKASDAFQDTFVKVFSRKDLFTDATNGRAWLYRIATNTCLNQLRYDRRHPAESIDVEVRSADPRMQPDFSTEQDSLRQALEGAIAKLPIELREPFLLRELEEFSYEDAAAQLGITVAACRQRVYRAKQLLREDLQEMVSGDTRTQKRQGGKKA